MEKEYSIEDWAWEIYRNGMKAQWVNERVTDRKDFPNCKEYKEYMELGSYIYTKKINK